MKILINFSKFFKIFLHINDHFISSQETLRISTHHFQVSIFLWYGVSTLWTIQNFFQKLVQGHLKHLTSQYDEFLRKKLIFNQSLRLASSCSQCIRKEHTMQQCHSCNTHRISQFFFFHEIKEGKSSKLLNDQKITS